MSIEPLCEFCVHYDKLRCRTEEEAQKCPNYSDERTLDNMEELEETKEHEYVYRFRLRVNSVPNLATILSEVVSGTDKKYPIEISADIPIGKDIAFQQAYEGVMTEVLGAVMAGMDVDIISEDEDVGSGSVQAEEEASAN